MTKSARQPIGRLRKPTPNALNREMNNACGKLHGIRNHIIELTLVNEEFHLDQICSALTKLEKQILVLLHLIRRYIYTDLPADLLFKKWNNELIRRSQLAIDACATFRCESDKLFCQLILCLITMFNFYERYV